MVLELELVVRVVKGRVTVKRDTALLVLIYFSQVSSLSALGLAHVSVSQLAPANSNTNQPDTAGLSGAVETGRGPRAGE